MFQGSVIGISLALIISSFSSLARSATGVETCDMGPADAASVIATVEDKTFILFGETHGTVEAPQIVGGVICHLARSGQKILVGFEMPKEYAVPIQNYVSQPDDQHLNALLEHPHWRVGERMDGRSSQAILGLINRIAGLKTQDLAIDVAGFDLSLDEFAKIRSREALVFREPMMAKRLFEMRDEGDYDHVIVLIGQIHSAIKPYDTRSGQRTSIGYLLPRKKTIAIRIAARGGAAWNCTTDGCGEHVFVGDKMLLPPWGIYRNYNNDDDADHHGLIPLEYFTTSPPAAKFRANGN